MWVALNEERPLFAFATSRSEFRGDRGTKSKPVPSPHLVYRFLTAAPDAIVEPIHSKTMPVTWQPTKSAVSGRARRGMRVVGQFDCGRIVNWKTHSPKRILGPCENLVVDPAKEARFTAGPSPWLRVGNSAAMNAPFVVRPWQTGTRLGFPPIASLPGQSGRQNDQQNAGPNYFCLPKMPQRISRHSRAIPIREARSVRLQRLQCRGSLVDRRL